MTMNPDGSVTFSSDQWNMVMQKLAKLDKLDALEAGMKRTANEIKGMKSVLMQTPDPFEAGFGSNGAEFGMDYTEDAMPAPVPMMGGMGAGGMGRQSGGGPMRGRGRGRGSRFSPMASGGMGSTGGDSLSGFGPEAGAGGQDFIHYGPDGTPEYIIFVYNIGADARESTLWKMFGPYGAISKVDIISEPDTGLCKGFGFVTMVNYDEACAAIHDLNGWVFKDKPLQVSFKKPKGQGKKPKKSE